MKFSAMQNHSAKTLPGTASARASSRSDDDRVGLALLLYTVKRRGDVVRMGCQHVRDGMNAVRQNKTGTMLSIAIRPSSRDGTCASQPDEPGNTGGKVS
jgi:hypothetical protein